MSDANPTVSGSEGYPGIGRVLVVIPTYNEAEARQQLAMVQLRAVEHGREALMVSTVGVSAFVGAGGQVYAETGFNVDAVVLHDMRIGGPRTLATRSGHWPETAGAGLALLALAGALPLRRGGLRRGGLRRRKAAPSETSSSETTTGSETTTEAR